MSAIEDPHKDWSFSSMISLYYFLDEFFLDVPSAGAAISRCMKIIFTGTIIIIICGIFEVSAEYAAIIYIITIFLATFIGIQYRRQRSGSKRG
jgi:hypothetical protein